MKKLSHAELLGRRKSADEALGGRRHPVSLLLYNIRSLYNVGSIFRTADSALVEELLLCGYTPHPPRKEIEKTALGAVDTVPWRYFKRAEDAIADLRARGRSVFALELTDNGRCYDSFRAGDYPLCLVLGNEISGIDNEVLALCDAAIEIPMYGVKHSLNVSVAAGIAAFQAVRCYEHGAVD